ncbi:TPA: hypothetical protein ACJT77_002411 [Citrobacter freundii]
MNRSDAPAKQSTPFGVNGQREPLLPTTPAGGNTASYSQGFPPITMILKSAGGLPPKGQDMNQILYELSSLCRWFSAGALNAYDSSFSTSIGGYPKGSVIISDDSSKIYVNTTDSNTSNPNSSGAGWNDFLQYLGLVPAIVLPSGYNIPFHIRNTPGILYSAQYPGTYTNEPDFDGEWFDVYSARHSAGSEGGCTFIAVSQSGKIATASLIDTTFSGWNRIIDGTNTSSAGREFIQKTDVNGMLQYLGLDVISGRLLNIVKMTASGTYTPTAGTKSIIVEAIGGGGASGNLTATASNQNAVSAAGSNGAYAKARYTSGFSSVSVTVGAGGIVNGGGGGNGGNGGTTTFGSLLTCPGGSGSGVGIAMTPPFNTGAAQPSGSPSGIGIIFSNKGPFSPWPTVVATGMASNFANSIVPEMGSYGMGGDGVANNISAPAMSGNAGSSGCVIVWEYS